MNYVINIRINEWTLWAGWGHVFDYLYMTILDSGECSRKKIQFIIIVQTFQLHHIHIFSICPLSIQSFSSWPTNTMSQISYGESNKSHMYIWYPFVLMKWEKSKIGFKMLFAQFRSNMQYYIDLYLYTVQCKKMNTKRNLTFGNHTLLRIFIGSIRTVIFTVTSKPKWYAFTVTTFELSLITWNWIRSS